MATPKQYDKPRWWHTATGYQIYPRSFADSNGDGIGDIPGIISRLDHLADLGIGFVWLSPVYASPMADNGYDISDYRDIASEYGTLADMDRLIAEARSRGIGIVMDLVVNHSSSEHAWFKAARIARDAETHDYYIWRDPAPDGGPPDDRGAAFGGPAWTFVPEVGQYYLHLFSPEQPDLNWRNPALRAEIYDMMRWWLDRGIAGFRMDVIDLIGKDVDAGIYDEGPYLHDWLREMHREALSGRDIVTVGESWAVSLETALDYCGRDRDELDMVFQFNHIRAGWDPVFGKFKLIPFELQALKRVLYAWQSLMSEDGWNSLFLSNHDLPRQVSKYGDDSLFRVASAKMLATVLHLMKGTPFVFQGEEIGMTNFKANRIDQYRDIEILRNYGPMVAQGLDPADFLAAANVNARDNGRTPVQWTAGPQAGFTTGVPWIDVNPNYKEINVAADRADSKGIFEHYRKLIALRRDLPVIAFGRFDPFAVEHPALFAYTRTLEKQRVAVIANASGLPVEYDVPDEMATRGRCIIANGEPRQEIAGRIALSPFEALAVLEESAEPA